LKVRHDFLQLSFLRSRDRWSYHIWNQKYCR